MIVDIPSDDEDEIKGQEVIKIKDENEKIEISYEYEDEDEEQDTMEDEYEETDDNKDKYIGLHCLLTHELAGVLFINPL